MEEFPAQSHKSREPREILPVTTSEARVRKAPWGRRLKETFIQGDAQSVWGSMFWNVFIPGLRDNVNEALHDGIDTVFGNGSVIGRRNNRPGRGGNRYNTGSGISKHSPDRALGVGSSAPRFSDDDRRQHNFSVLEIDSRVEAEEVLSQMLQIIDQHDVCMVAEFLQMVRISPTHADYKFGWEELGNARVVHSRGSYYIDLPDPIELR